MTHLGGKPNTGTLILQKSGYAARVWTVVDGVRIRKTVRLNTMIRVVAKVKLSQLLENPLLVTISDDDETYAQLAKRVAERRKTQITDWKNEASLDRLWVLPIIGPLALKEIKPHHISAIYERARSKGRSRGLIAHVRATLRSRFAVALEEGLVELNPLDRVKIPKMKTDNRERAVLSDFELQTYLSWTPEDKCPRTNN